MINLAGVAVEEANKVVTKELIDAGIPVSSLEFSTKNEEVKATVRGFLGPWSFTRDWYYWRAKGTCIPTKDAMELHEKFGKEVRVAGHCGCPSPKEWYGDFGVPDYHVDTEEGLKALADTIKSVMSRVPIFNDDGSRDPSRAK